MAVELWYAPSTRYPGGFKATFNTRDEALAQAAHDLAILRGPAPVRIEDGTSVESVRDALEAD